MNSATLDQLQQVEGIGTVVAESILPFFASDENQALLAKFSSLGVHPQSFKTTTGPLTGVSFVITGTLSLGPRDEVAARLVALGAKEHSSVTKDTTYLIVGENPGASKPTKAKKLGTVNLDEAELTKMLRGVS